MSDEFEEYAEDYDAILNRAVQISGEEAGFFAETKVKLMRDELTRARTVVKRVLDFGCGTGNLYEFVRRYFPASEYCGVDHSKVSIEVAQRKWRCSRFFHYAGERLPFDAGSFDVVIASVVFHHIPGDQHRRVLAEIHRVLSADGAVFVFEHNPYNPLVRRIVDRCPFDKDAVLLPPRYARRLFRKSPFRQYRLRYYLFFPRLLGWLRVVEPFLAKVPLGAQYLIWARKSGKAPETGS